jgi:hypothetical protein
MADEIFNSHSANDKPDAVAAERDLRENRVRTRSFFDLGKRRIGSLSASVFQARLRVTSGLTVIQPELEQEHSASISGTHAEWLWELH